MFWLSVFCYSIGKMDGNIMWKIVRPFFLSFFQINYHPNTAIYVLFVCWKSDSRIPKSLHTIQIAQLKIGFFYQCINITKAAFCLRERVFFGQFWEKKGFLFIFWRSSKKSTYSCWTFQSWVAWSLSLHQSILSDSQFYHSNS